MCGVAVLQPKPGSRVHRGCPRSPGGREAAPFPAAPAHAANYTSVIIRIRRVEPPWIATRLEGSAAGAQKAPWQAARGLVLLSHRNHEEPGPTLTVIMLLFPAQVKVSRRQGWFRRRTSRPLQPRNRNMATNSNSTIAFSTAGAATLTATVCVYLTSAHVRTYTIPLGLAVLVALVGLTTWNLSRGGSAALGIFTLKGSKTAGRRAPRPAAPPHQPKLPASAGETPRHRHRPPHSRQTAAQEQPPRSFLSSSRGSSHAPSYRLLASRQPARPRTRTGRQPSQQAPRPSSTPTTRPSTTGNGRRRGHSPASRPQWAAPLTASGPTATAAPSGTRSRASRLAELPCWSASAHRKAEASPRLTASATSSGAGY